MANCALFTADMPVRIGLRLRRAFVTDVPMRTLLGSLSAVMYPVFYSVTASGSFGRPAALGLLLRFLTPASQHRACRGPRVARPFGVSVPPETSLQSAAQNAAQTSFGPLPESRPSALGAGPLAGLCPV